MIRSISLFSAVFAIFWTLVSAINPAVAGTKILRFTHDGKVRSAEIFVPERRKKYMALVVVLHGGGGTYERIRRYSGFNKLARREQFVVVYPGAAGKQWNDGRDPSRYRNGEGANNDIGYLSALIDRVVGDLQLNPDRVYVAGPSNGGMMSFRVACELSDKVAAVTAVIANMPARLARNCNPTRPVPVQLVNGTADRWVPYNGGKVSANGFGNYGRVMSTNASIEYWLAKNRCRTPGQALPVRNASAGDGTTVDGRVWPRCAGRSEVRLVRVVGGGHTWAGTRSPAPRFLGLSSEEFRAEEEIWRFVSRFRR